MTPHSDEPVNRPAPPAGPEPLVLPYVLDCLEHGSDDDVRRHLVALGYTPDEAGRLVTLALDRREQSPRESAWSAHEAPARRCMNVGFLLLVLGIVVGFGRVLFVPRDAALFAALGAVFWCALLAGLAVFFLGVAQLNIRR